MTIDQSAANSEMEIVFKEAFEADPDFAAAVTAIMRESPERHPDADPDDDDDAPRGPSEEKAIMMLFHRVIANPTRFPNLNASLDLSFKVRERDDIFGRAFGRAWYIHFVGDDDLDQFEDDPTLKWQP
jgi:hypothetical protein